MINNRNLIVHDSAANAYRVDMNNSMTADKNDPILVKRDPDAKGDWKVVDTLEGPIDRDEVGKFNEGYGLWKDKELTETKGMLWWKKTEVLRPKDGNIQEDEVTSLDLHHFGPEHYREIGARGYFVGAEIATTQTPQGTIFFLNSNEFTYSDRMVNAKLHASNTAQEFRNDDSNWLVNNK